MNNYRISYKKLPGYKNILHKDLKVQLDPPPELSSHLDIDVLAEHPNYFTIWSNGLVLIRAGYAWDGASGPTIDTKTTFVGSCVHDCLYQGSREFLKFNTEDEFYQYRKWADQQFRKQLKLSGMNWFRRMYWYRGVREGGEEAARSTSLNEYETIHYAP